MHNADHWRNANVGTTNVGTKNKGFENLCLKNKCFQNGSKEKCDKIQSVLCEILKTRCLTTLGLESASSIFETIISRRTAKQLFSLPPVFAPPLGGSAPPWRLHAKECCSCVRGELRAQCGAKAQCNCENVRSQVCQPWAVPRFILSGTPRSQVCQRKTAAKQATF